MPFLPGLSPVQGKAVVARFDGGRLSSAGGLLALREIERRIGVADRLAACLKDPRAPERVQHRLAEIIRLRMLMIAAGYEDGNDAEALRRDPMFKLALDRLPSGTVRQLATARHQDRRPRRRAENPDKDPSAVECPRSEDLPPRPRPPAPPGHLKNGAACPAEPFPANRQHLPDNPILQNPVEGPRRALPHLTAATTARAKRYTLCCCASLMHSTGAMAMAGPSESEPRKQRQNRPA